MDFIRTLLAAHISLFLLIAPAMAEDDSEEKSPSEHCGKANGGDFCIKFE